MKPNKLSAFWFKLGLNLYPPFFFGRVKIREVKADYTLIKVQIKKSILNINGSKTIFGGTMFAAADPFFPLMYLQIFAHQFDKKVKVWTKSAEIYYKKPAVEDLYLEFRISQEAIAEAKAALDENGKSNQAHEVALTNKSGEVCAIVTLVSYIGLP